MARSKVERIIHDLIDLSSLPESDATFYGHCQRLAENFRLDAPTRHRYADTFPAEVLIFHCIDEREQDTELFLGIPQGFATIVTLPGGYMGEVNVALWQHIKDRVDHAADGRKRLLTLFVTHRSQGAPLDDSCAAWNHDISKARVYAKQQVNFLNGRFVDRSREGTILDRRMIAVHLDSVTDTENRIWHGANDQRVVNPRNFMTRGMGRSVNDKLADAAYLSMEKSFPYTDVRFQGMKREEWIDLLKQMSQMCVSNVLAMREKTSQSFGSKNGHKGTSALVGDAWQLHTEPEKYFKVSHLDPVFPAACRIPAKYMLRNAALLGSSAISEAPLVFYVGIAYDDDRRGHRSDAIQTGLSFARAIKRDLEQWLLEPEQRDALLDWLKQEFTKAGISGTDARARELRDWSASPTLIRGLRLYVSVMAKRTRIHELVATTADF